MFCLRLVICLEKGTQSDKLTPSRAFILAAQQGYFQRVRDAIENGIDLDTRINLTATNGVYIEGTSALHEAAANGHLDIVELLVNAGVAIDSTTAKGWTPLHAATFNKQKEAAVWLVEHGADSNARDTDGFTPINGATFQGRIDIVEAIEQAKQAGYRITL